MNLKRIILIMTIVGLLIPAGMTLAASNKSTVPTSFVYQAISKYKNGNYTGCIQDLDYAISHGRASDVVYYYKALSYARLGMPNEAKSAYQSAHDLTSNKILAEYTKEAVACINDPTSCGESTDVNDISNFIRSKQFLHPEVKKTLKEQAIIRAKNSINSDTEPSSEDLKYINHDNSMPTDKEIADAVRTFQKLGINPFMGGANFNMANSQNQELMQLNAIFNNQNNNNNNNMMNLVPMISALQAQGADSSKTNKDIMQAYMLNQMLPNFNFGNNDK